MNKKKISPLLKKIIFAAVVLIIALVLSFQLGFFKKNCKEDRDCFNAALKNCNQAKFFQLKDFNYYSYTVLKEKKGSCIISVKMEKMAEGTSIVNKERFEGKEMACKLPSNVLNETTVDNIQGLLNYCSGPLKESIYELIIEKLYGIVLNNIGDVVVEVRDVLKEVK